MGIWRQMQCVSGSGKSHERLKRCCRKEQRSTLKSECSTANTVAVTRRCFNLMNSQFVLLQFCKGKKTLGHRNGDVGDQVIWSNLLLTFLCWRNLSRNGKTTLKFLCKMWKPHLNSNLLFVYSITDILSTGREGGAHGFFSCKVMSKVLYMGAGHTGHVLPETTAVKLLTPEIRRCDNDWTSVVPLRRNVVSKTHTNSFYTLLRKSETYGLCLHEVLRWSAQVHKNITTNSTSTTTCHLTASTCEPPPTALQ
jgi:hypothetical protein